MSIVFNDFTANYPTEKMSEEAFHAFCAANPDLRIEQDQYQNVTVMPGFEFDLRLLQIP